MPYDFHWYDDEQTIIRLEAYGKISWDAWHETTDKLAEALVKASHRLDFIFVDHVGMPPGNPLPHLRKTIHKFGLYPNLGLVVSVNKRPISIVNIFLDMVMPLTPESAHLLARFVPTLEEALEMIAEDRAITKQQGKIIVRAQDLRVDKLT
jgi:hypothetical protein